MPNLDFTCPFCKTEEHSYQELAAEPGRRAVPHDCTGVQKRTYVFVDRHTETGVPIYLCCRPVYAADAAEG